MRIDEDMTTSFDRWSSPYELTKESSVVLQERIFSGCDTSFSFADRDVVHHRVLDDRIITIFQDSTYPEVIAKKAETEVEASAGRNYESSDARGMPV